jgi:hypothetical protein
MGIRDDEIKRLIHYAKGLGVRVVIHGKTEPGAAASWSLDGSQIDVYTGKNSSKTETILALLHELGHHLWFIHEKDRQPDLKFDEAIARQNIVEEDDLKNPAPKSTREKIYQVELAGTKWWDTICKDTNIKIPEWKVHAAMVMDMWMYEQYRDTGFFPKGKIRSNKRKFINSSCKTKRS